MSFMNLYAWLQVNKTVRHKVNVILYEDKYMSKIIFLVACVLYTAIKTNKMSTYYVIKKI